MALLLEGWLGYNKATITVRATTMVLMAGEDEERSPAARHHLSYSCRAPKDSNFPSVVTQYLLAT